MAGCDVKCNAQSVGLGVRSTHPADLAGSCRSPKAELAFYGLQHHMTYVCKALQCRQCCPAVSTSPAPLASLRIDSNASGSGLQLPQTLRAMQSASGVLAGNCVSRRRTQPCVNGTSVLRRPQQVCVVHAEMTAHTQSHLNARSAGLRGTRRRCEQTHLCTARLHIHALHRRKPAAVHHAVFAAAASNATPPEDDPNGARSADAGADQASADANAAQERRREVWARAAQLHAERQVCAPTPSKPSVNACRLFSVATTQP